MLDTIEAKMVDLVKQADIESASKMEPSNRSMPQAGPKGAARPAVAAISHVTGLRHTALHKKHDGVVSALDALVYRMNRLADTKY
jgi:hypothetical protein